MLFFRTLGVLTFFFDTLCRDFFKTGFAFLRAMPRCFTFLISIPFFGIYDSPFYKKVSKKILTRLLTAEDKNAIAVVQQAVALYEHGRLFVPRLSIEK